jgi:quercetin dioxygenase-like cupin family protein
MSTDAHEAVVLKPGEGSVGADPLGHPNVRKASAGDTNGAYTLTEATKPPGLGAPPHVHVEHEEAFYVIDGELELTIAGDRVAASAGAFALVPRNTEHSFSIVGATPARYLCIFSPPATHAERQRLAEYVTKAREQGLIR